MKHITTVTSNITACETKASVTTLISYCYIVYGVCGGGDGGSVPSVLSAVFSHKSDVQLLPLILFVFPIIDTEGSYLQNMPMNFYQMCWEAIPFNVCLFLVPNVLIFICIIVNLCMKFLCSFKILHLSSYNMFAKVFENYLVQCVHVMEIKLNT
ncbi:Protein of unknown function [Gryllus bimaculatus]|nr:Protein of unknown function [Gryllus bimaculatus]